MELEGFWVFLEENVLRRTSIKFETGDALSSLNNITVKESINLYKSILN